MSSATWLDAHDVPSCAAAGMYHTVALTENTSVVAFGSNLKGQLGVGKGKGKAMHETAVFVRDPRVVDSQTTSWKTAPIQIACGALHTALLLANGELFVWGLADGGRLGIDPERVATLSSSPAASAILHEPTRVPRFAGHLSITHIACGTDHTLCVDRDGDVWTWGIGSYGNLGHGGNKNEPEPRPVEALRGKVTRMLAGGAKHSACVTTKGEVYTWGHGDKGRLGNGVQRGTSIPELVEALQHEFCVFVECGEANTAAISDGGALWTWGAGSYGRLGNGGESDAFLPTKVEGLIGQEVIMVSLGVFHSLAVTRNGTLWAWGGGQYGKLGLETSANVLSPRALSSTSFHNDAVIQAFAGVSHSLAICSSGSMYTWGDPTQGKLGRKVQQTPGAATQPLSRLYSAPEPITLQGDVQGLRITPARTGMTLPARGPGALGNEYTNAYSGAKRQSRIVPQDARGTNRHGFASGMAVVPMQRTLDVSSNAVRLIAAGSKHSLVLTFNGAVFAWGGNEFGQVGDGSREDVRVPVRVTFGKSSTQRVVHVAAGANHSLCCLNQGDTYAWGRGNEAQIGTGSTITETVPILVQALQGHRVVKVFGGESHSAGLSEDGALFTWGDPDQGKLGQGRMLSEADPSFDALALPRVVQGHLASVKVVDASLGTSHSACIDSAGKVYTWGSGWQGKLGLGTTENQYTPQRVLALQFLSMRSVSCGAYHTLFVTDDGDLYACGRGDARLGLGETTDKLVPELNATLRAAGATVARACAAEEHSLAVTVDGRVWTWGKNAYAKLGLGHRLGGAVAREQVESMPRVIDSSVLGLNNERYENRDDIRMVAAFANHSLALAQDSRVYAWGSNGNGRLGLEHDGAARLGRVVETPTSVPHFQQRLQDQPGTMSAQRAHGDTIPSTAARDSIMGETLSTTLAAHSEAKHAAWGPDAGGSLAASLGVLGATAAASTTSKHLGNDAAALEAHIRDYMENGKVPPLYVVQLFLKAEPQERQAQSILFDSKEKDEAEDALYRCLIDLVLAERDVQQLDYTIGLTVTTTIRQYDVPGTLGGAGAVDGGFESGGLFAHARTSGDWNKGSGSVNSGRARTRGGAKYASTLTREIGGRIPSYEKIFVLLLANPRYMINMYEIYVLRQQAQMNEQSAETAAAGARGQEASEAESVAFAVLPAGPSWRELYFELVESVYAFGDAHCNHLLMVLARSVLRRELEAFSSTETFPRSVADDSYAAADHVHEDHARHAFFHHQMHSEDKDMRRSLRSFLDENRGQCSSFQELATRFFSQDAVTTWLRESFASTITDLHRGHQSRTASGEELRLSLDPIRIYNELHGDPDASLSMNPARAAQVREEYANYPDVRLELDTRIGLLKEVTLVFLNQISKAVSGIPNDVKLFCRLYHDELQRHFEYDTEAAPIRYDQAVAKFLVDHLLRPAFLSPKQRHLLPRHFDTITPQQHQNMVQVVKLLQAIVLGRPYRKERLEPLNVAIRQHHAQVQTMVNDLLNAPSNLEDALYTDLIMEYLRPRGDSLRLQASMRSLRFVRFALHHPSSRLICSEEDPLARVVSDPGGILSDTTDRIGAENFAREVVLSKDDENFKVNVAVEMRFLELDPDAAMEARLRFDDAEEEMAPQGFRLRAGLRLDPLSMVPVPSWMLDRAMKSAEALEDLDLGQSTSEVEKVKRELVDLPELPPTGDWSAFREGLEARLEEEVKRFEFVRAAEMHRVILRLTELEGAHGPEAHENLLRQLLSSLLQRRKAAFRLHHQHAEARFLEKRAEARLAEIAVQRSALEDYMRSLRLRVVSTGPGGDSTASFTASFQSRRGRENEYGNDMSPRRRGSSGFKRSSQGSKLQSLLATENVGIGAYNKYTLTKLVESGVVTQVGGSGGGGGGGGGGSSRSSGSSNNNRANGSLSGHSNGNMAKGNGHQGIRKETLAQGRGAEVFARSRASVKLLFFSKNTGEFLVFVVLRPGTLLDSFEISIPQLMEMERTLRQTFRPSAKLPIEFSVSRVKTLLEEIAMKMIMLR
ncbi:Serine/threonine-protein kinase Nek8 [Hondaea fermentalgiana]|uniref:Serine/threonine-protein kinase Nek8 n=1 Tax=Hondaea fermentalgiana TaxID=2315210 RepID=A0A2R5GXJ2_9STRA|nr:Serine/threonine-protein kinase Nek8 [Hondaea fermentalgiana]|eukprot:GBG32684.1 Serine/threonine-protein kinase Nek8 [Hondaea fermentalgiana]